MSTRIRVEARTNEDLLNLIEFFRKHDFNVIVLEVEVPACLVTDWDTDQLSNFHLAELGRLDKKSMHEVDSGKFLTRQGLPQGLHPIDQ